MVWPFKLVFTGVVWLGVVEVVESEASSSEVVPWYSESDDEWYY